VGLSVDKYKGVEASVILSLTRRVGLEFIELTQSALEEVEKIIPKMEGVRAGFHLPLIHDNGWDFSCIDHREKIDRLIGLINRYWRSLNLVHCVAHPPEPFQAKTPVTTSVPFLFENLARLEPSLVIENVPGWTAAEFDRFYEEARRALGSKVAGLCYDAPHHYLTGVDPIEAFHRYNGHIRYVHLSDCSPTEDLHLPFGRGGVLPIDLILQTLKTQGFEGYITLELLPRSIDDLEPVIQSYLKVLKVFRKGKYLSTKVRLIFLLPLLRKLLS